jgi:hypothetical protein
MTKPIAIIDVDETLWSFSKAFYDKVKERGYDFPVPAEWDYWSIFWKWIPKDKCFPIFDEVHCNQCDYPPYKDAKEFLDFMHEHFHIIIASHRDPKCEDELKRWLEVNQLKYDEIHTSFDKSVLFDKEDVVIVVDDNPETMDKAIVCGIISVGLSRPWNKKRGYKLFSSLTKIKEFVEKEML